MDMIWMALAIMVASTLIVNLGLGEAIADVSSKILKCPVCLTFWSTMAYMYYYGADITTMLMLSISMAYLSNYFGLVVYLFNLLYDRVWEILSKRGTKRGISRKRQYPK